MSETYFVLERGHQIDVLEMVRLAVGSLEPGETVDVEDVAKFYLELRKRQNTRVLKRENPFQLDYRRVDLLVMRVSHLVHMAGRIQEIRADFPERGKAYAFIDITHTPCEETNKFHGRLMSPDEVPLLPLPQCPLGPCLIDILVFSQRQAAKKGLI